MKKVNRNIPIHFEVVENYDTNDSRFQKVKIWLMHLGKNYNNSIFEQEVTEEAMSTLANTPILGYIEESKLGDKDFRGHEVELVVEDGELSTRYIGQAYGLIPESCNPRFEQKLGDDGEMLTYVVVDGLLWSRFDEAIDILNENGEVAQSMELDDEFDGYWDEEGFFRFTKFRFNGACMLGKDVLPAMQRASVESVFSASVIQDEISKKLEEFHQAFSKNHFKEVEHMTLDELLAKYSVSVEDLEGKGVNVKGFSIEELEEKIKELFSNSDEKDEDSEKESDDEKESTENKEEDDKESGSGSEGDKSDSDFEKTEKDEDKVFRKFALSHDDIRNQIWSLVDDYVESNGIGERWDFWINKVYDDHIIIQNEYNMKLYKVDYTKENDLIQLGENVEVFASYLTLDEKNALDMLRSNYEKLEEENSQLKEFKSDILKGQHEAEAEDLFAQFNKLSEEDIADIRENVHQFSIEEIESKLYEILGRKTATFSKKETPSKIQVKFNKIAEQRSNIDHYFQKHGIKK